MRFGRLPTREADREMEKREVPFGSGSSSGVPIRKKAGTSPGRRRRKSVGHRA